MKISVVLFNLGGPGRQEDVREFLFNLFNDPAIIGAPGPVRWALAQVISRRRTPVARQIYAELGGGSPLLENTQAQAAALQEGLADLGDVKVTVCMRYWHPMSDAAVAEVAAFGPDRIVLLPLYPQFSTTTSGSSFKDWDRAAKAGGLVRPTNRVCCYPRQDGLIAALAGRVKSGMSQVQGGRPSRVLFSAHGLPKKVIAAGDPYQWQVEQAAEAVVDRLATPGLDWVVCYQSRVGPLEWIGPSTDDEVRRAGNDGVAAVVVPIVFVSEHSETLVELDIEYAKLAAEAGVPQYVRVPTVDVLPEFVGGLADLVREAVSAGRDLGSCGGGRICPAALGRCPVAEVPLGGTEADARI